MVASIRAADAGGHRLLGGGLRRAVRRGGVDGVGGFQRLDPLGQLGDGQRLARLGRRLRQPGLELVA